MNESCYDVVNTPTQDLQHDLSYLTRVRSGVSRNQSGETRRRANDLDSDVREIADELRKRGEL